MGTVIAVGTMLQPVIHAVYDMDVTILYYTTIHPFDYESLKEYTERNNILVCAPDYVGTLSEEVINSFQGEFVKVEYIGVKHKNITTYGSVDEINLDNEMDEKSIRKRLEQLLYE